MANDLNRSIKIYLDNSAAMTSADELQKRIGELEGKLLDLRQEKAIPTSPKRSKRN